LKKVIEDHQRIDKVDAEYAQKKQDFMMINEE